MAIKRTLEERGVIAGAMITSGNETGLTSADYITYFAQDPATRVIACYLESIHDSQAFLAACRRARDAGKPVVAVKLGASEAGRAAAAAHTGALAGSMEAFDAVAGEAGALRVRTLDDLVESVEYLVHAPPPCGDRLASITFSGRPARAHARCGRGERYPYPSLSPATAAKVSEVLGVGTIIGNPLDGGFAALTSVGRLCPLCRDPARGSRFRHSAVAGGTAACAQSPQGKESAHRQRYGRQVEKARRFRQHDLVWSQRLCACGAGKIAESRLPAGSRQVAARGARRGALCDADRGAARRCRHSRLAFRPRPSRRIRAASGTGDTRRDEFEAVARGLRNWLPARTARPQRGRSGRDRRTHRLSRGRKVVSAALPHKSDVGGVIVDIKSSEEMAAAYRKIVAAVASYPGKPGLDGILIAEMVSGGLELVLGASRDAEMGPVGIVIRHRRCDIELVKDVALAVPPLDEARAGALIGRTRAARLIDGYRGRPVLIAMRSSRRSSVFPISSSMPATRSSRSTWILFCCASKAAWRSMRWSF